jgi:hypothetical protein
MDASKKTASGADAVPSFVPFAKLPEEGQIAYFKRFSGRYWTLPDLEVVGPPGLEPGTKGL